VTRILRAVPRPLIALLAAVLVTAMTWALFTPPWQSPDETQHFAYAQTLAERFVLPGDRSRHPLSSEHELADNASRSGREARIPGVEWSAAAFGRWRRAAARLPRGARRDGGGPNAAAANPPLYYGYEAIAYRAAAGTSIFGRLYAMRVWSALLLLVTTTATWLLAGELLGRSRPLQLAAGAVAGLAPMTTFMTASVNPDAMLYALWSLALWLGVRILRRGLNAVDAVALLAVCGLAVTVKATSYALLAPVLLVLAVSAWRQRRRARRALAAAVALAALAFAVPAGGWLIAARALSRPAVNQITAQTESDVIVPYHAHPPFNARGFLSYLRQFYLPSAARGALFPHTLPVYSAWFKGALGTFGWRQFRLAPAVFFLLAALCLAALVAAAVAVARGRVGLDWQTAAFLSLAVLGLLVVLHLTEYRIIFLAKERDDFNQGRYLLPLVSLGAVTVAAALSGLRGRGRAHAVAALLGGLVVLQALSLGTVAEWFYG
jgi:4-amino-4-deoxy-L-arabinose transferase-like glycosyltransferase